MVKSGVSGLKRQTEILESEAVEQCPDVRVRAYAMLAQMVEQLFCKQRVGSSSLSRSSNQVVKIQSPAGR